MEAVLGADGFGLSLGTDLPVRLPEAGFLVNGAAPTTGTPVLKWETLRALRRACTGNCPVLIT